MSKTRARSSGSHPRARPKLRPPTWYARPATWGWILGIAALGGLALFAFLPGSEDGDSPARPFVGGDLHSLVVDPADPSRVYVGGHDGVAASTDGGKTWRQIGTLDGADAMGWAFAGNRTLVGGHPGLFASEDGGRTFEQRNEDLPATDLHALGADGELIYAASPQLGVFASSDGGRTWEVRTDQAGQSFMGRILVDPSDPDRLVAPDMQAGAAQSTDGGRTWRALGGVPGAMWVSWDWRNTDHLVVSGMGQASVSTDGGRAWAPLDVPGGVAAVEMSSGDPKVLFAAALDGTSAEVWISRDGGSTWRRP